MKSFWEEKMCVCMCSRWLVTACSYPILPLLTEPLLWISNDSSLSPRAATFLMSCCQIREQKEGDYYTTAADLYIWTRSISVQCSTAWTEAALPVLCFDLLLILDAFFGKVPWGWWQCLQVVSRRAAVGLGWANAHTFISAQPRTYAAHVSFSLSCAVMSNILTFFLCYLLLRITSVVKKNKKHRYIES